MAKSQIRIEVDTKRLREVAEAVEWFAGRLSAAADELLQTLDAVPVDEMEEQPPDPRYPEL